MGPDPRSAGRRTAPPSLRGALFPIPALLGRDLLHTGRDVAAAVGEVAFRDGPFERARYVGVFENRESDLGTVPGGNDGLQRFPG
ncbi:MAG: hypothetical protein ABEI57_04215 [Halapricum sp.]